MLLQALQHRASVEIPHAERLGDGGRHQRGVGDRRQIDQKRAVLDDGWPAGRSGQDVGRDLEGEAGLADATGPGQRHQARAGLDQGIDLHELALTTEQYRGRTGRRPWLLSGADGRDGRQHRRPRSAGAATARPLRRQPDRPAPVPGHQ